MTYINSNSLSDNLEVDMLRTMVAVVTIVVSLFSSVIDGLWLYFLAISVLLFVLTLLIKRFPNGILITMVLLLLITGITFQDFVLYSDAILNVFKVTIVLIHFVLMSFLFWKVTRTLLQADVVADISVYNRSKEKGGHTRNLTRRRNRRASFRSKNSVKIKSGQYRG